MSAVKVLPTLGRYLTTNLGQQRPFTVIQCKFTTSPRVNGKIKERVLFVLQLNQKVDKHSLTLNSHFLDNLGMNRYDHSEIINSMEEEFQIEIPDNFAETMMRPIDIVKYVVNMNSIRSEFDEEHEDWRKRVNMAYF